MLPKRPSTLLRVVEYNGTPLYELGLADKQSKAVWPIVVNYLAINGHSYLTPAIARELAAALIFVADECDIRLNAEVGAAIDNHLTAEGRS